MRGIRSFIALLVIGIAVAAAVYWDAQRDPAAPDADRPKVFAVEADKIEEVTITAESGERTTLRKAGDAWQIASPSTAAADAAETSAITTNLSTLSVERVVDEQAADLGEYGLEQPRIQVAFKAGSESRRLSIGRKTPPGSDLYARVDDEKKVFLIPSHLESTFNRGTFDLRDKGVLRVEQDKVDAIEVLSGAQTVQLVKADGEWKITQPIAAPADLTAVNSLVGRLAAAQMKSVEATPKPDMKAYGLDKPAAMVRLGAGSSRATLLVGGQAASPEGAVYARDESRPEIFTIDAAILEDLKRGAGEYRQKDLFDARAFNTNRVEAIRGGQTVAFEKTRVKDKDGKEEEKWRQVVPAAKDVDSARVDAVIFAASSARAESFVDAGVKTGVESPELVVVLKFDDGKREDRVSFARAEGQVYAARAGVPGTAKVDAATLDNIIKALDELK